MDPTKYLVVVERHGKGWQTIVKFNRPLRWEQRWVNFYKLERNAIKAKARMEGEIARAIAMRAFGMELPWRLAELVRN